MTTSSKSYPPGPQGLQLLHLLWANRKNPLWFLVALGNTYGDAVHFRLGHRHVFFFKHPDAVRDILVTHGSQFVKGVGHEWAKQFMGEGLLTSEGKFNARQRQLMQPAFHRDRLNGYGREIVTFSDTIRQQWKDGDTVDVADVMRELTLTIVCKTLFGATILKEAQEITAALSTILEQFQHFYRHAFPLATLMDRLPLPANLRFRRAAARLRKTVADIIQERRLNPGNRVDVLSMLLSAQEPQMNGHTITEKQIRDEVMTLILNGHESTANALSWTWYLLFQHPAVESRFHEELSSVLNDRLPSPADIPHLRYTHAIFSEALRLFPPAFGLGRRAIADVCIGNLRVPKGSSVIVSAYVTHRDPRFFTDPTLFDPERWMTRDQGSRPEFAYFPFGGGMRRCIGEHFAWMEGVLILATIAQRCRLRLVPGHPVEPHGMVVLRPKYGMRMQVEYRVVTPAFP